MKTKKVISYLLLLIPLALPAACSPINSNSDQNSRRKLKNNNSDQLRGIVDDYFEQEENYVHLVPVESDQEKKEELAALEKTGEWSSGTTNTKNNIVPPRVQYVSPDSNSSINTDINISQAAVEPIRKVRKVRKKTGKRTNKDFPITVNKQVEFYLDQFRGRQRNTFRSWLERSARYLPFITRELKKAGLPEELGYLAMIESGFNPSAYSRSHASGLWQFIPGTGRDYGLRIDSWVDERRDPEKSTKAAIAYLKALYKRFGNWHLAVAAYNAGEGKIEQGLKKYRAKNFWELARHQYLHLETKRYVPKLIAAILIARKQRQYGFRNIQRSRPISYDLVRVPSRTHLGAVAASASLSVKELRKLNNDLLQNRVPPARSGYVLKVPEGSRNLVTANLSQVTPLVKNVQRGRVSARAEKYALLKKGRTPGKYPTNNSDMVIHQLSRGETLSEVSRKYNIPIYMLMRWNDISDVRRVQTGTRLRIYPSQSSNAVRIASAKQQSAPGAISEPLELISQSKERPKAAEDTGKAAQIGSRLSIYPSKSDSIDRITSAKQPASGAISGPLELISQSKERPEEIENKETVRQNASADISDAAAAVITLSDQKKQKPVAVAVVASNSPPINVSYYKVRNGDSLWSIARKLQVSTGEIRRWNSLRNSMLRPGTRLVIRNT